MAITDPIDMFALLGEARKMEDAELVQRLFAVVKELERHVDKLEERLLPPQRPKLTPLKGGKDA